MNAERTSVIEQLQLERTEAVTCCWMIEVFLGAIADSLFCEESGRFAILEALMA